MKKNIFLVTVFFVSSQSLFAMRWLDFMPSSREIAEMGRNGVSCNWSPTAIGHTAGWNGMIFGALAGFVIGDSKWFCKNNRGNYGDGKVGLAVGAGAAIGYVGGFVNAIYIQPTLRDLPSLPATSGVIFLGRAVILSVLVGGAVGIVKRYRDLNQVDEA